MKSRIPASLLALAPAVSAGVFVVMFAVSASAPVAAAPEKSRGLRITKECSNYSYLAGDFCTITSSNLDEIPVDSTITYDQAFGIPAGMLDSNVVLDAGNGNWAVGRCTLVGATGRGVCTFSDGAGTLAGFSARVDVSTPDGGLNWKWKGTYSLDEKHGRDR